MVGRGLKGVGVGGVGRRLNRPPPVWEWWTFCEICRGRSWEGWLGAGGQGGEEAEGGGQPGTTQGGGRGTANVKGRGWGGGGEGGGGRGRADERGDMGRAGVAPAGGVLGKIIRLGENGVVFSACRFPPRVDRGSFGGPWGWKGWWRTGGGGCGGHRGEVLDFGGNGGAG